MGTSSSGHREIGRGGRRVPMAHGFDAIVDVKGGMLGGNGTPGWIPAGLPVKAWEGER